MGWSTMTDNLWRLDASELARLIRLGRVSSREATESCLPRQRGHRGGGKASSRRSIPCRRQREYTRAQRCAARAPRPRRPRWLRARGHTDYATMRPLLDRLMSARGIKERRLKPLPGTVPRIVEFRTVLLHLHLIIYNVVAFERWYVGFPHKVNFGVF
jgi:hypothetical protein